MTGTDRVGASPLRPDGQPMTIRQAVRALIIDHDDRVLLVRFEFRDRGTVWAMPGGGIDPGEETVEALRRELVEELGLHHADVGPQIWDMTRTIPEMNPWFLGQHDVIHLVRTAAFEPQPMLTWEELRAESLHEIRWWTLEEVEAATDLRFAPRRFPLILRDLFDNGPPVETLAFAE
jgi:8-oxo-dGTP pyrophosphatase MutT (NUDIX family)